MTAAGVQKKSTTVDKVKEELLSVVEEYIRVKEEENNASNTVKWC